MKQRVLLAILQRAEGTIPAAISAGTIIRSLVMSQISNERQQFQMKKAAKVGCQISVAPLHSLSRFQLYRNDAEKISMAVVQG